ncbi:hypothetical protein F4556_005657 [Kitasatospora gansuensis]|uniref:Chaplin domain-containing protein n=1 Tax=Kitasatospora gansuensis TaxID=258050 RepID=A0A7W7SHF1_9ACTN|nr:hypothetical protein [Kitasatospora gansuensis]MBB4950122.1 hypothetical protein [Kitasatospora gansuensis]
MKLTKTRLAVLLITAAGGLLLAGAGPAAACDALGGLSALSGDFGNSCLSR